jgi:hypothetical protein
MRSIGELRDQMLEAPEGIDELPPQFMDARSRVREAIALIEAAGIPNETLVAVLMSEMLPRMVHDRGPLWTATLLAQLSHEIGTGAAPSCARQ